MEDFGPNSTLVLQPLTFLQFYFSIAATSFLQFYFSIATTSLSVLSVAIQRGVPPIERGCF